METLEKNKENSEGSLELSNELKRLQRSSNPLKIFKEMSVLGIGSGVKSIKNILFFTIVNLIFFLVGVYLLFSHTFAYKKLFFLLLMIGIGVLFVFIAIRKVFDLLKMEYGSYLFNQLSVKGSCKIPSSVFFLRFPRLSKSPCSLCFLLLLW